MDVVESLPQFGTPARDLFEQAHHEKDKLRIEGFLLDEKIAKLQSIFAKYGEVEDFQVLCDRLTAETCTKVLEIERNPIYSWNDYFRLFSRMKSIDVTARTPVLFYNESLVKERKELVNGLEGVYVEILSKALKMFDTGTLDSEEKGEVTGAINELTALAILNRFQASNRVAAPASTIDDLTNKTDIDLTRISSSGQSYVQHVQVKTSPFSVTSTSKEGHIVYLHANDMRNYGNNFFCSRTLVKECDGQATQAELNILETVSRSVLSVVDSHHTYIK